MRLPLGLIRRFRRFPSLPPGKVRLPAGIARWLLAAGVVAALAVCGAAVWFVAFGMNGGGGDNGSESAVAEPTLTPTPVPDIERLIIPAIQLDVPVTAKAVGPNGEMPSPDGPEQVIWYDFSRFPGLGGKPGAGGNTVLAGHVEYHDYGPAVFAHLQDLKMGDMITVELEDGSVYKYVTHSNRIVNADVNFGYIVTATPEESLTLITCAGDFDPTKQDYNERRIVWAVRVG